LRFLSFQYHRRLAISFEICLCLRHFSSRFLAV
jgi:hypothetical protein